MAEEVSQPNGKVEDEALDAIDSLLAELADKLDTATSGRALRNMPFRGPLDYAVMKSHLIVQAAFADVVFGAFPEKAGSYIYGARLTFQQYGLLARAVIGDRVPDWVWAAATKLNEARNTLSHQLEPGGLDKDVQAFVDSVAKHEPRIGQLGSSVESVDAPVEERQPSVVATCFAAAVLYVHLAKAFVPERELRALVAALDKISTLAQPTLSAIMKGST